VTGMLEVEYVVVLSDWLRICCNDIIFISYFETGSKTRELLTCVYTDIKSST
jgi:hypothetical protein